MPVTFTPVARSQWVGSTAWLPSHLLMSHSCEKPWNREKSSEVVRVGADTGIQTIVWSSIIKNFLLLRAKRCGHSERDVFVALCPEVFNSDQFVFFKKAYGDITLLVG